MACKPPPFRPSHQPSFDAHRLREEVAEALRRMGCELGAAGRLVGEVIPYAGVVDTTHPAPDGWLLCNGQAVSQTHYAELFSVIGTAYGGTASTFQVPDLRGRTVVGAGTGTGLTARALADTFGAETHTHELSSVTVDSHTHSDGTLAVASHTHGAGSYAAASHQHNLSAGWACIDIANNDPQGNTYFRGSSSSSWTATGTEVTGTSSDTTTRSRGVELIGDTGNAGAAVTGTSGSAAPDVTGSTGATAPGITGDTDAGDSCQPSLALNYLIFAGA